MVQLQVQNGVDVVLEYRKFLEIASWGSHLIIWPKVGL